MCRSGSFHDFHGIGVANLIFGLLCILLPLHALHEKHADHDKIHGLALVTARDTAVVIGGLLFTCVGIVSMVLSRRWMEKLRIHILMQILLGLAIIAVVICPIIFLLNVLVIFPGNLRYGQWLLNMRFAEIIGNPFLTPADTVEQFQHLVNDFQYATRFVVYRFATTTAFILISVGELLIYISLAILICKTKNFRC